MCGNVRRYVLMVAFLTIVALGVACEPATLAKGTTTSSPLPTPTPPSDIQVGVLQQLPVTDERLRDWQLTHVHIEGDVLVGLWGPEDQARLVVVNLLTGEVAGLDTPFVADGQWPASKRYIVWAKPYNNWTKASIRVHDTATGEEWEYGGEEGRWLTNPTASGAILVWEEKRATNTRDIDIHAYDITSQSEITVVQRTGYQLRPKVDGEWIVYIDDEGIDPHDEMQDVYVHNLVTGEDFRLGISPFASKLEGDSYGIANGRVVWIGWTPDQQPQWPPALHVYDLASRRDRTINTPAKCEPIDFHMARDLILFPCKDSFGGYDLARSIPFQTPFPHGIGKVYLSETKLVFQKVVDDQGKLAVLTPDVARPTQIPPTPESTLARFQLFVASITRR